MHNLADHLFRQARHQPSKVALRFEGCSFTFDEIAARVRRIAGGLASIGIGRGSHVGLMAASCPEFIFYQHAIFSLGAVFTPLNIFYKQSEILHAIHSCGLEHLILGAEFVDRLTPRSDSALDPLKSIVAITDAGKTPTGGFADSAALIAEASPIGAPVRLPETAVAMMLSTSATTGKSKGVMLTLGNIVSNYDRTPGWLGLTNDTVTLCALPLYNTFGLNQCINALMYAGGSLVLMPKFDALACLELIERHRCTFLPAVPTMLQKILDHPEGSRFDLSSIKRIMTGGAPVPAALLERIYGKIGADTLILTGYGLTEGTALVTLDAIELAADGRIRRPKSIGKVLDGMELKILREDGSEATTGEVGEICLKGPNLMLGYYRMPEDTKIALSGGWLHTGDLGYLDADGYGYIVDRKKDIIIRGGQNIYPADIESVLYQVPGVAEAAVVRKDDPVFGEVPVAFVALQPGASVTAEQLIDRCRSELAYFKVPAAVHFLTELPKGPTGKILRRALGN
jgi:long-chain acyl-CoA synthetase